MTPIPNARGEPRPMAAARHERRLLGVGSSAWFGWVGVWTPDPARQLREHESTLGLGDGPPQFLGRLNPFRDDRLDVRQCFLVGGSVRCTAGQFWDFRNDGLVLFTPIQDDFIARVMRHRQTPQGGI